MLNVHAIPAFKDNYIWLIGHTASKQVIIVDPGEAEPVIDAITQSGLTPVAILITHQHYDHVSGVSRLLEKFDLPVYGHKTQQNDVISIDLTGINQLNINQNFPIISILVTPGHCPGHMSYLIENNLFCGDTLFSAGCGRLLDENARPVSTDKRPIAAKQLHDSLGKISKLSPNTRLYCAHEYTLSNLDFALAVEPNNPAIHQRLVEVALQREQGKISLPSTLEIELATNPFLRCEQPQVIEAAQTYSGSMLGSAVDVFSSLRKWKDNF